MNKNEMILSKRMQMVAGMVTKGSVAADIGCDHGFVPIYLIEQGICPQVIAMDVNEGPLLRAKEHICERGLTSLIDVRLSDGMDKLQDYEADSVIIAGMGGRLVIKILSAHMDRVRNLREVILQPQSEIHLVRYFLADNGFCIVCEDMVEETGKYYPCIKACYCGRKEVYTDCEAWYGPLLLRQKHPVLREYLLKEKRQYGAIAMQIRNNAQKTNAGQEKEDAIKDRQKRADMALSFFEEQEEEYAMQ